MYVITGQRTIGSFRNLNELPSTPAFQVNPTVMIGCADYGVYGPTGWELHRDTDLAGR